MASEAQVALHDQLWQAFFHRGPHAVVVLRIIRNESQRVHGLEWVELNRNALDLLRARPEELIGRALCSNLPATLTPGLVRRMTAALHAEGGREFEFGVRRPPGDALPKDGAVREQAGPSTPEGQVDRATETASEPQVDWFHVSVIPAHDHAVVLFRSITAYKNVLREAVDLINHDDLTGLANRRQLRNRYWMLRQRGGPMAVLYFDLNGFKQVNDLHGHDTGDRVLSVIGRRLNLNVRPGETVARIGGDEFAVLLADPGQDTIDRVAERLLAAVEEPVNLGSVVVRLSASVGAALHPQEATTFEDLLGLADSRMYDNKRRQPSRARRA